MMSLLTPVAHRFSQCPSVWLWAVAVRSGSSRARCRRYTWATIAFLGTAGSQIWTYKLIQGLRKHNAQRLLEQEKPKIH